MRLDASLQNVSISKVWRTPKGRGVVHVAVSKEEVQHIALLSRLALTEAEIETFADQLSGILDYATQLDKLDTSGVDPMFYPLPLQNVFREDVPGGPLPLDRALANASKTNGSFFEVPKVADGS
jgi:aspartyl-tRNA(Asn)/glutamyl-tRNA(Gln) amidotransferase subunit C